MKLLICNVGSTSLKYQLFDMDAGEAREGPDGQQPEAAEDFA